MGPVCLWGSERENSPLRIHGPSMNGLWFKLDTPGRNSMCPPHPCGDQVTRYLLGVLFYVRLCKGCSPSPSPGALLPSGSVSVGGLAVSTVLCVHHVIILNSPLADSSIWSSRPALCLSVLHSSLPPICTASALSQPHRLSLVSLPPGCHIQAILHRAILHTGTKVIFRNAALTCAQSPGDRFCPTHT